ncbi:hypothetical protein ACFE04_015460 [Oxalis oulophora]
MSSFPSTQRKRPKPKPTSTSSSSSSSSIIIPEPPQSLFPSKTEFFRIVSILVIASSVALLCNFLSTIFINSPKPFCDHSFSSNPDVCEPCPSNGVCEEGKLECLHSYRKQGNLCVEDGDINETAKKLSKQIESHLCEVYAKFVCDGAGTSLWVSENDIWNDISGDNLIENYVSDNSIYLYTKKRTMETIDRLLETRISSNGMKELKCPESLGKHYKPYSCRIQQWASQHVLIIVPVCALLMGCALLLWKIRQRWKLSARVEDLYHQALMDIFSCPGSDEYYSTPMFIRIEKIVCDILEENALASRDVNGGCEPWIVASRLRDHLLLPKERKDLVLWKKVEDLVKEDSRVDMYPKLVKGESRVVWEWQVEGSLSSSLKRKKQQTSKLMSFEDMGQNSNQKNQTLKAGKAQTAGVLTDPSCRISGLQIPHFALAKVFILDDWKL